MKKSRKLHIVSGLVILIGILVIADGIGSILLPGNNHDFIYDFEREIRVVAGFLNIVLGIYLEKSDQK
jgi:hypothetical protein